MAPTRLGFDLDSGGADPPLERKSSMSMQAKNAVGFNTPGAASSAADFFKIFGRPWASQNRAKISENRKKTKNIVV